MKPKEILVGFIRGIKDATLQSLMQFGKRCRVKQYGQVVICFVVEFMVDACLSDDPITPSSLKFGISNRI